MEDSKELGRKSWLENDGKIIQDDSQGERRGNWSKKAMSVAEVPGSTLNGCDEFQIIQKTLLPRGMQWH